MIWLRNIKKKINKYNRIRMKIKIKFKKKMI